MSLIAGIDILNRRFRELTFNGQGDIAMSSGNRRKFLKQSGTGVAGAVALSLAGSVTRASTTEKVTLGVIGTGGMGGHHVRNLAKREDAQIAYVCDVDEILLGRQRCRRIGLFTKVGNQVCPVFRFTQTGKTHRGAGDEVLRGLQEVVQLFVGPLRIFAAECRHRRGETKTVEAARFTSDNVPKRGTDFVGAALIKGVACHAFLRDFLAWER